MIIGLYVGYKGATIARLVAACHPLVVCCSYSTFMLWSIPHYKKSEKKVR